MNLKNPEIVNNVVSELRASSKETQSELALAIGVTRQTIIAIEKGAYIPSVLLALKIAKHYKQPVEKVFYV